MKAYRFKILIVHLTFEFSESKEISYHDFLVFMRSNGEEKTREFRSSFTKLTKLSKKSKYRSRGKSSKSRSRLKLTDSPGQN